MKYFIDTEFIESGAGKPLQLLSIGIVAEDGREFYRENKDADRSLANDWVRKTVFPELTDAPWSLSSLYSLRAQVLGFIGDDPNPEFWGWCCDYDYVLLSQLVGFNDWPDHWPYYFRDIQQVADAAGIKLRSAGQHHALKDAREESSLFASLMEADNTVSVIEHVAASHPA